MENQIREFTKRGNRRRLFKRVVSLLCVVVLLFTMNTLKRNANTLERIAMCGLQEHTHTAGCYNSSGELVCAIPEHVHTDACYQQSPSDELVLNGDDLEIADGLVDAGDAQSLDLSLDLDQGDLLDFVQDSDAPASNVQDIGNDMPVLDGDLVFDTSYNNEETQQLAANTSVEEAQGAVDETQSEEAQQLLEEEQIAVEDGQDQPTGEGQEQITFEEDQEQPVEQPTEAAQEQPVEEETEQPVEEEQEQPVEEETEQPVEEETEQPAEEAQEQPVEEAQEQPVEEETEQPVEGEQLVEEDQDQIAIEEQLVDAEQEQPAEEKVEQPAEEVQEQLVIEGQEEPVVEAQEEPVVEEQEEPAIEEQEEPAIEEQKEPVVEEQEEPAIEEQKEPVVEEQEEPVVEEQEEPAVEEQEEPVVEEQEEPVVEEQEEPAIEEQEEPAIEEQEEPVVEEQEEPVVEEQEEPVVEEQEEPVVEEQEEPVVEEQEEPVVEEQEEPAIEEQEEPVVEEQEEPVVEEQEEPAVEEQEEPVVEEQEEPVVEEQEEPVVEEQEEPVVEEQEEPVVEEQEEPVVEEQEEPVVEEQEEPVVEEQEEPVVEEQEEPVVEEQEEPVVEEQEEPVVEEQEEPVVEEQEEPVVEEQEEPAVEEQEEPAIEEQEEPAIEAAEQPTEEEAGQPAEEEAEQPAEEEAEQPTEEEAEQPAEEEAEQPAEEEAEQPAEEEAEQPAEENAEQAAEEEAEQPAEEEAEQPTEEEAEQPAEEETEEPAIEEAEQPAEVESDPEAEGESEEEPEAQIAYPAKQFQQGTAYINVSVDAPEGAFPEGTVMVVKDVEDQGTIDNIQQSVAEDFVEVTSVHAVDISFWYNDAEIEPLLPIAVVMSAVEAPNEAHETVVVHVDDNGETQLVDSEATGAAEAALEMPAAADAEAQAFEADTFSVYALVTKQVIETKYIDDHGDTWRIKVDYGKDAKLPEGASLQVSEVTDETYLAQAEAALETGKRITKARFFDIKIMDGDREVQPDGQVKVTINLVGDEGEVEAEDDQADIGNPDVVAMHFVEQDDEIVSVETKSAVETDEGVVFNADSFSAWGVVYTVDFEYTDPETGRTITWRWPGEGVYNLADIMAKIGASGRIKEAALSRIIDMGGDESVLRLVHQDGAWYLTSEKAFQDTFELTVVTVDIDGGHEKKYNFIITDDPLNQGVTANTYFITPTGSYTSATAESGQTLTASIALTNSNTETDSKAYVRVDIAMDPSVQKKGYWPNDGQQASIVIQNLNGDPTVINYTYHENGGHPYILYEVPAGATAVAKLNFATPNGITPDGTKVTLTPSIANSDGSYATPASNDKVSAPAVGTWEAEFGWDDIDKTVSAEQVLLNQNNQLTGWLKYNFTANTQNAGETGEIWTDRVVLTDTLTLPDGMTFKYPDSSYTHGDAQTGWNLTRGNELVFGLSNLGGLDIQDISISVSSDKKSLTYTITAKNPKRDGNTVTAEMNNINYQAELNLNEIAMTDDFVSSLSETNNPAIKNSVDVTETSIFNQDETSKDEVQTIIKGNDGYDLHKTGSRENDPVVKPGDRIDYTVTLTNTNASQAFTSENVLEDSLPETVILDQTTLKVKIDGEDVSTTYPVSYDQNTRKITCPAKGLPAGKTLTITYTVTVKDVSQLQYLPSGSTIDNTVVYRGARDYTSYTLEKGHYTVEKAVSGTAGSDKAHAVADGEQVTYTLKATADKGDVSPVIMEDTLPPYLKLLNVKAPNGTAISDLVAYRQSADWSDSSLWDHSNGDYLKVKIGDKDAFVNVNNGYVTIRYVRNETLSNGSSDTFTYTVQFDASKADDAANEGYVYYDNTVTTPIGETDHADFYGKFGELGVDKQIVSASKDGVLAIGPYENETVLTYSVTVTNNTENPYTKPTFTVTDELPAGLFPVVDNESYKTKAALDAALESGTNDFTINGRQVNIVKNGGGYKLTWTISNNPRISSITLRYPAQIDTTDVTLNAAGYAALVNTVKVPGASDQEIAEVKEPGLEMDKIATSIVNGKGSIIDDRHVLIQKGSQVTYTLTLKNPTAKDIVATNVYDYFPVWLNNGSLQQSNNYWSTSNVSVSGDFEGHHAGGNTMSINNNRVEFGSVRVPANTTLTETVTLTFPTNIELYQALLVQEGSNSLNRFHVDGLDDAVVDHTMENDEKFYLQKGVVRFDKRVDGSGKINHDQQSYTSVNSSRDIYRRADVNEVTYYVVLANTGGTNLHVDQFVDYLPDSLELLNTIKDPSQNFFGQEGYRTTTNAFSNCFVYDNGVLEQNNTTDWLDEGGTNHQGGQGIPLAWDNTTGKITFDLNDGKGVTIAPKHVVMFYFRCKIKDEYIDRTDIDAITNSVQAVLDGEPDIKRTSIKENQGAGSSAIQNNGGCTIVEREGGKTIAESSVTIHPMDAVVPGIQKTAKRYWEFESNEKGYKTDAVALRADHNQNIKSQSKVEWEIVLRNDGTEDMTHGYTVTDNIPVGHRIATEDVKGQSDNVFVTSYVIYDQNNTELRTISVTDDVFTGASIEGTSTTGYKATFIFTDDAEYQIPAGGYAVMKLVSDFIEGWDYQGRIDNEAAFYPNGDWNANLVRNGELIKNDDGTAYTGVKASDYVNAFGEMATSSNKKVEEVDDASNSAYGYEAKNTITVPHGTKRVKYTLQVTDLAESAIDRLVMIDRLPEIGDTGVNNLNNQRGSEFSIGLPSNLVVKVKGPGDHVTEHTLVNGTHYKVQYSTKVAFDDEDYNASFTNDIGTGWSDTPFTGAKSFRILFDKTAIFNEYRYSDIAFSDGDLIVPKNGGQIKVEFEAPIGEDANPGETAYNSFGYRYYTMNSGSTYLQAEPPKVGVRIEPQPALQKRVLDENDQNMGDDAANLFQFSIYAWPTTGGLAAKTEVEVQEALANKTPEQVASLLGAEPVFTAEVPQGGSVDLPRQVREDGTARIIFEDGKKYIVVEQAKPGYYSDGYEIGGLKKSQANVAVFTYSVTENTVVVAVNKEDVSGFTPMAYKALVTRDSTALTADRFSFRLQEYTDGTYTTTKGEPLTATNAADGNVEFAKIDYTEASTHYYRMSEVVGNETGIIYDQTMYNVVVVVTEKGAGRFGAVPTYYKVTGEQTTPEALAEGQVPQFVNTESTEIQVEKVWAGDVQTGEATMVLYRATSVPTDSFVVNVNASLTNRPVGSANITATFSGEGDTKTVELSNGNNWSGQVALKRGVSYTVSYTTNKPDKIQFTSDIEVSGITDPTTLTVTANAEAAQQYTYTFTVPGDKPANGKGSVDVSFNGQTKTLNSGNNWRVEFTDLPEESTYRYTVSGDNFITTVEPTSGEGTVSDNATINLTLTPAAQTMTVPVSVSWDGDTAPDSGNVTVTLTPASGTAQTVTLNSPSWSGSFTDIPRLDDSGNLIEYTVSTDTNADSASVSVATPGNGKISGEGTVVVNGVVNRGNTFTIKVSGTQEVQMKELFTCNSVNTNDFGNNNYQNRTTNYIGNQVNGFSQTWNLDEFEYNFGLDSHYVCIWFINGPYSVKTNASIAGSGNAWGTDFVYVKAQSGSIIVDISKSDTWDVKSGVSTSNFANNATSNALSASRNLSASSPRKLSAASPRLASNGGSGSSGSKKFYDSAVGGSGNLSFTAIQAKDLPVGAVPATDVDGYEYVVSGDGTHTWSNLPAVDESGNLIYYYVVEKDATADADRMSVRYAYEYNTPGDPTSGISKVTITNSTEKDAPKTGNLSVTKTVSTNGDTTKEFIFTVTLSGTSVDGTAWNAVNGTFGGMTFNNGVATFTLKHGETKTATDLPAGLGYTVVETHADGYATSYTGNTGTIPAGETANAAATNTYSATGTVDFKAEKVFTNGNLGDHAFTFKLTQVTGNQSTTQATSNVKLGATENKTTDAASGTTDTVNFDTITFTKNSTTDETGDYWFLLEEDVPADVDANGVKDGIKYDRTQKWIKVTVTDAGNGTLTVFKTPDVTNGVDGTWINEQLGSVKVTKAFSGVDSLPQNFKITATWQENGANQSRELTLSTVGMTGKGTIADPYTWTIGDLPLDTLVTFTESGYDVEGYTVEVTGSATATDKTTATATVKSETQTAAFVNTYTRNATYAPKVTKTLEGREWKQGDQFTFTLSTAETNGLTMPTDSELTVTVDSQTKTKSFGNITFTAAGTYAFTVKEKVPDDATNGTVTWSQANADQKAAGGFKKNGITYDGSEKALIVKVEAQNHKLVVTEVTVNETSVTGADAIEAASTNVTNTYDASGKTTFDGVKQIENRRFKTGDTLTVSITSSDGGRLPTDANGKTVALTAGQNTANFSFAEVEYTYDDIKDSTATPKSKTFNYNVTETATMDGTTADTRTHTVEVTVTDNGDGTLNVVKVYKAGSDSEDKTSFVNTFDTSIKAQIKGTKDVTNGGDDKSGYRFTLAGENGAPTPDTTTVTSVADGSFEFGEVIYTLDMVKENNTAENGVYTKTYTYTVTEQLPEGAKPATAEEIEAKTAIRDNIKYDIEPKKVTVTVTYNEKTGEMTQTVSPTQAEFVITNVQLGELVITKTVVANGEGVDKSGTFWYAVFKAEDVQPVGEAPNQTWKPMTGKHTVSYGYIEVNASGTGIATVSNLPYGDYYVFELSEAPTEKDGKQHLTIIPNDTTTAIGTRVYTVTGSGTTAVTVGETAAGQATLTNTVPETSITGQKTWKPFTSDQGERKNPVNTTLTLTLTRYIVNGSSNDKDDTFGDHQVRISAGANGDITLPDGRTVNKPDLNTEEGRAAYIAAWSYTWADLPLYDSSTAKKYVYMVDEAVDNDMYTRETGNSQYLTGVNGDTTQQFTNIEKSPVSLPSTGGVGTGVVYGAGAALMLLAVLGLILLNRKRTDGEGIR